MFWSVCVPQHVQDGIQRSGCRLILLIRALRCRRNTLRKPGGYHWLASFLCGLRTLRGVPTASEFRDVGKRRPDQRGVIALHVGSQDVFIFRIPQPIGEPGCVAIAT